MADWTHGVGHFEVIKKLNARRGSRGQRMKERGRRGRISGDGQARWSGESWGLLFPSLVRGYHAYWSVVADNAGLVPR